MNLLLLLVIRILYLVIVYIFNTRPAKIMRGTGQQKFECTGEAGPSYEDTLDWCLGWVKTNHPNCTKKQEYEYESPAKSETTSISASPKSYGGGGYVLRLKGYVTDMEDNLKLLQKENWINNRTRSLILEFSVYNAQVTFLSIFHPLFAINDINCTA
jgi:hypothetical protein